MTVRQIINELQGFVNHLPVVTSGYERGYSWLDEHGNLRLNLNTNTESYYGPHKLADDGATEAVFLGASWNSNRSPFGETPRSKFTLSRGAESITAGDLIGYLKTCPPEMKVVVCGYEAGYSDVDIIRHVILRLNVNHEFYYGPHEKQQDGECGAVFIGSLQADQDKTWNLSSLERLLYQTSLHRTKSDRETEGV